MPRNRAPYRPEFASVGPRDWTGRPVIIVGGGPSLTGFDFERLRGVGYVLAVKQSWKHVPFADACFGLDLPWLEWACDDLLKLQMPLYVAAPDQTLLGVHIETATYIRRVTGEGLSDNPAFIHHGGHSGFGALNFAWLRGARRVFLFGYDYTGDHHDIAAYQGRSTSAQASMWYLPRWVKHFVPVVEQAKAAGVEIINASPGSLLDVFERVPHDEALQRIHRV